MIEASNDSSHQLTKYTPRIHQACHCCSWFGHSTGPDRVCPTCRWDLSSDLPSEPLQRTDNVGERDSKRSQAVVHWSRGLVIGSVEDRLAIYDSVWGFDLQFDVPFAVRFTVWLGLPFGLLFCGLVFELPIDGSVCSLACRRLQKIMETEFFATQRAPNAVQQVNGFLPNLSEHSKNILKTIQSD